MAEYLVLRTVHEFVFVEGESPEEAIATADTLPDDTWRATEFSDYEAQPFVEHN